MAKKQLIKLTEEDLHNIIKESVNNILAELDWRTYDAAEQAAQDKMLNSHSTPESRLAHSQMQKFHNAKIKRQNQQYDGISDINFDGSELKFPNGKLETEKGVQYGRFHDQNVNGLQPVSPDKQRRGAAQIARHKRGGDTYDMDRKKWVNK